MIIVRPLSTRAFMVGFGTNQAYSGLGAGIVMESIALTENRSRLTDLTQIDGIDVMAATTVVSEVGWDMSKWKSGRPRTILFLG
jgi:hypothetical protein